MDWTILWVLGAFVLLDAARCFEKAGEAVRVVDVLASAGLRAELERFLPRCTDPLALALARRRMPA